MAAPSLMIALGKSEPKSGGSARAYAREAFSALKDDDEDGFIEAFLGAVRACAKPKADSDDEAAPASESDHEYDE